MTHGIPCWREQLCGFHLKLQEYLLQDKSCRLAYLEPQLAYFRLIDSRSIPQKLLPSNRGELQIYPSMRDPRAYSSILRLSYLVVSSS